MLMGGRAPRPCRPPCYVAPAAMSPAKPWALEALGPPAFHARGAKKLHI